eukprot:Nitzschia sp. Nitz4//scaffold344_size17659//8974//12186//NITZ4_008811-RA/size17659-snap-gene-0.33-mRNA-1//1//CDS//3329548612//8033//frame0
MEIKKLGEDSIQRIVAEQAITNLSSIVKELVDNALDAESTTIKIRMFGQGLDIIEVSDDGTGVPKESRPFLAQRYATSKIGSFEDIYTGTGLTMGFRGEALFSMACLSDKLVVATRCEGEEMAQKLEFGRDGVYLESQTADMHRKIGTTVAVVQPFAALPARRVDMMRRIRAERMELHRLMEAYAIFNVGVQLNLIDIGPSGKEEVRMATSSRSTKLEETISSVLGSQFLASLVPIEVSLDALLEQKDSSLSCGINGLVSKNPQGDMPHHKSVHYYSINGRVVELPSITHVLRRVWSGFGGKKKPSCVLGFTLPNNAFDINLAPDKQKVLLSHEQEICQMIEETVTALWATQTQGVFEIKQLETPLTEEYVEDDSGERQKHKRRYAFVHDLARAKLQHDSEERHRCELEEEQKKQAELGAQLPEETANPGVEGENASATMDPSPPHQAQIPGAADHVAPPPQEGPGVEKEDRVSDLEKRKWLEIQAKFNSDEPSRKRSRTMPVTPDDMVPLGERERESKRQAASSSSLPNVQASNPYKSSSQSRQASLKEFSFQPMTRSSSKQAVPSEPGEPNTQQSKEPEGENVVMPSGRSRRPTRGTRSRRLQEEEEDETEATPPTSPEHIEQPLHGKNKGSRKSTTSDSGNCTKPISPEDTGLPVAEKIEGTGGMSIEEAGDASSKNPPTEETTTAPVIWANFGTNQVCREARRHRFQMVERKLGLNQFSTDVTQDPDVPTEVKDSVGTDDTVKNNRVSLSKEQFRDGMEVIGQFNLGFILARCKNNNLWILDQHACDEKYNFEQLRQHTALHEQKLLKPMPLDLSAAEEACVLDNMDVFEANGFRFAFDSNAPIRQRLSITALPHSGAQDGRKAVQFNKDDVRTLCCILMEGSSYEAGHGGTGTDGTGQYGNNAVRRYASTAGSSQADVADRIIARLPKAIAMFASRACRTSIMIGTALSQQQMEKIVKRLADVENPWNCPHGRPTMRHVGDVLPILRKDERMAAEYMTGPTLTVDPTTQEACPSGES